MFIRQARKDFITAKYTEKRFARKKCPDATSSLHTLCEAVKARDIFSLIQVYAEGVDLMEPIPLANGHVSAVIYLSPALYLLCNHPIFSGVWLLMLLVSGTRRNSPSSGCQAGRSDVSAHRRLPHSEQVNKAGATGALVHVGELQKLARIKGISFLESVTSSP